MLRKAVKTVPNIDRYLLTDPSSKMERRSENLCRKSPGSNSGLKWRKGLLFSTTRPTRCLSRSCLPPTKKRTRRRPPRQELTWVTTSAGIHSNSTQPTVLRNLRYLPNFLYLIWSKNIKVLFTLFLRQDRACWRDKTFSSFSNEDLGKFSPGIAARYPSPVIKHLCRFTTTITNLHIVVTVDISAGLLLVPSLGDNWRRWTTLTLILTLPRRWRRPVWSSPRRGRSSGRSATRAWTSTTVGKSHPHPLVLASPRHSKSFHTLIITRAPSNQRVYWSKSQSPVQTAAHSKRLHRRDIWTSRLTPKKHSIIRSLKTPWTLWVHFSSRSRTLTTRTSGQRIERLKTSWPIKEDFRVVRNGLAPMFCRPAFNL